MQTVIDKGWLRIVAGLAALDGSYTKVGLQDDGRSRDAGKGVFTTNAAIGAVHEFGAPGAGIPRRPFLSAAYEQHQKDLSALKARLLSGFYQGKSTAKQMLSALGQVHADQVKRKMTLGPWEKLKASTIARKGSSKPLVDTGALRTAITHVEVMR